MLTLITTNKNFEYLVTQYIIKLMYSLKRLLSQ